MKTTIIDIAHIESYGKKDFPDGLVLFSDEWNLRKYQCENFINSRNGIFDRKIHGRKCIVKEISAVEGKKFFSNHHIQGSNNLGIVFFGLFYKDELIGVMSLGRHSRQIAENRIVLDRFCIAYGVHVRGGANKLFHKCVEWAKSRKYDEIISFSDNRLTDGNVYKIMGFYLEKNHKPDYCYVDTKNPVKRLSKQSQKKSSSKCPDDLTEFEWAEKRGLKKLWDKGKKRWVYNLDDSRKTWKQNLSQKCAEQDRKGEFKHSHIRGYFFSNKCGKEIYYGSSYELRCIYLLEKNSNVLSYERAEVFVDSEKNSRNPDIKVTYIDNSKEILEVKPESRFFKEENVKKQILETEKYAKAMGYKFSVWTEKNSGLSDASSIIKWAKIYIGKITGNKDWLEKQKENGRKRSKKHYDEKISTDKVSVYCEFCKEEHKALRLTYEKNIARNNRYICEREGGYIAGSKPKLHLRKDNNHVNEGKKQCNECNEVLPFERFSPDSSRRDGYCSKCKECRSKKMKERYNKKKT